MAEQASCGGGHGHGGRGHGHGHGGHGQQHDAFYAEDNPVNFRDEYTRTGSVYTDSRQRGTGAAAAAAAASAYGDGESAFGESTIRTDDVSDEIARLYGICESAMPRPEEQGVRLTRQEAALRREQLEQTWESIREWLTAHPSPDERQLAATHLGHFSTTALHLVCKLTDPPVDIVRSLIECSPATVTWQDLNGWLPLHHACANGSSGEVLSLLCESYPDGKVAQDRRDRTPLHFAFFRSDAAASEGSSFGDLDAGGGGGGGTEDHDGDDGDDPGSAMAEIVALLSDTGAARLADEGGMLPMHYACAYGTSAAVLEVLEAAHPASVAAQEKKGRTPLHLAMVNAHRCASPSVLAFLLESGARLDIVNIYDNEGHLPLYLLAMACRFRPEQAEERSNAGKCLRMYLDAGPKASADFLSALQALPEWLRDTAVVNEHVQSALNEKIVKRFPTSILMLDGYMLINMIVCFSYSSGRQIDYQFMPDAFPRPSATPVILFIVGGVYFLLREIIQMVAMLDLGTFRSWLYDADNWLDATVIFLVFYEGALMSDPSRIDNPDMFRNSVAITQLVLWLAVLSFLKSTLVGFAVFLGGLFYVLRRLIAFLVSVGVFLIAFGQMFHMVYAGSEMCEWDPKGGEDGNGSHVVPHEGCYENFPHCDLSKSLLRSYSMMMGEIGDECRYIVGEQAASDPVSDNLHNAAVAAQVLYFLYAFIVVIVLSTVLIAVVTDSFGVIKNERAAMVFWSNRLDFVAEMDAIGNFSKMVFGLCFDSGLSGGVPGAPTAVRENPQGAAVPTAGADGGGGDDKDKDLFHRAWSGVMTLFGPDLLRDNDVRVNSMEFWFYQVFRLFAIAIIPLWLLAGLATAGWLWPPQVRAWLFAQKRAAQSRADVAEQIHHEIDRLKREVKNLRRDFRRETKNDQREMACVRGEVDEVQRDVMSDLSQVKEIMTTLFELSRERVREREELGAIDQGDPSWHG